jgi:hypothetical protein
MLTESEITTMQVLLQLRDTLRNKLDDIYKEIKRCQQNCTHSKVEIPKELCEYNMTCPDCGEYFYCYRI